MRRFPKTLEAVSCAGSPELTVEAERYLLEGRPAKLSAMPSGLNISSRI